MDETLYDQITSAPVLKARATLYDGAVRRVK